jgi:hypothetical protein
MPNTLGPGAFGAARAVTSRPSVTPDNTGPDSWFKDCSSPTARDGTELRAAFLNAMIAQFREIRRANGRPEDNADSMAMRAIRSQRANFVAAAGVAGTANAVTLTFDPPFASIADLLATPIRFLVEQNSTAAVTISVDGLAAQSLVFLDGTAVGNNGLVTGRLVEIMHDGTRFVAIAGVAAASGHTHPMTDILGLQTALDGKVAKAGDTISGTLAFVNDVRARFQSTGGAFVEGASGMQIGKGADNNGYFDNFNNDMIFRRAGSAELLRLAANGRVGINTASPLEVLDVGGSIRASSNLVVGGGVSASGSFGTSAQVLIGGAVASWSDRRTITDLPFTQIGGNYFWDGLADGVYQLTVMATMPVANHTTGVYGGVFVIRPRVNLATIASAMSIIEFATGTSAPLAGGGVLSGCDAAFASLDFSSSALGSAMGIVHISAGAAYQNPTLATPTGLRLFEHTVSIRNGALYMWYQTQRFGGANAGGTIQHPTFVSTGVNGLALLGEAGTSFVTCDGQTKSIGSASTVHHISLRRA